MKNRVGETGIETEKVSAAAVAVQEVQHHADNRPPHDVPELADNRPPLATMPTTDLRSPLQSCSAEFQCLRNDRDSVKIPDHHAERLSVATAGVTSDPDQIWPDHHADGPGPGPAPAKK